MRQAGGTPLTVLCDFDGTIVTRDVGHALCETFAPGALDRVDRLWLAGQLSFAEAFRQACAALRGDREAMVAHAVRLGELRAGFEELVRACLERDVEIVVSSAGLDLYIEPILRARLPELWRHLELHVNVGRHEPSGVAVEFPHADPACPECGNCKGLRARRAKAEGRVVVAVGDSYSDKCLAPEADHLFARDWLAQHCLERGIPHAPFDDFAPVTELVRRLSRDLRGAAAPG